MRRPHTMSVLAIISNSTVFDLIRPFLARSDLEVNRRTNAVDGLGLCHAQASDLVVAQYPLSGFAPLDFFRAFYRPDSASARAPLLVVTRGNRAAEIQRYLEGRKARACYLESADDGHLHQALYELVGVSARCSSRLLITAEVDFGSSSVERVYQTANVSKSGFLVKAQKPVEPGTILPCRLQLPQSDSPLEAIAEVVRITDDDKEGIRGFGVRILDFEGDGQRLLARFVDRRLGETQTEEVG